MTENDKNEMLRVILCKPGETAEAVEIDDDLESMQELVGGLIQEFMPFHSETDPRHDDVAIICNEEGKINGLELNRALRDESGKVYDILAGTFLIVGLAKEGFASLSTKHQEKYYKLFEYPEIFLSVNGDILAIRVEDKT